VQTVVSQTLTGGTLAEILAGVERGALPPADGTVRLVPAPAPDLAAVLAFAGCNVVAADVEPAWLAARIPAGDLSAPLSPAFLTELGARVGRRATTIDMVVYASPLLGDPPLAVEELADADHPRVRRARAHRRDVRVWGVDGAVVTLGRGLAGRWEVSFEVPLDQRGRGLGRRLVRAARHLLPVTASGVWAQVAPGNAASVRALLAAGYVPIGSEALFDDD
jgi:hypothetical protein